jgi:hypothetical protein
MGGGANAGKERFELAAITLNAFTRPPQAAQYRSGDEAIRLSKAAPVCRKVRTTDY